jgi:uncharacterized protein (TIGR00297 family)
MKESVMLDTKGFALAILFGIAIYFIGGVNYLIVMLIFLFLSVWATRYGAVEKKEMQLYEYERGWKNVFSNGLIPFLALLLFKRPELFLSALAAAQADKFASELGVLSSSKPIDLATLKPAEVGTNGAISLLGSIMALAGALLIGLSGVLLFSLSVKTATLIGLSGFVGCMIDSIAGIFEERGIGTKETSNMLGALGGLAMYYFLFFK